MGVRKLVAVVAAAGVAVVLGGGLASAATERITRTVSGGQCSTTVPGHPPVDGGSGIKVTMDVPTTAVVGVPTDPVPWEATGHGSVHWGPGSALYAALVAEGATTLSATTTTSVYLGGDRMQERVTLRLTGTAPIDAETVTTTGSGQFPPMTFSHPSPYNVMLLHPGGASSSITPLKADGTPTSFGTLRFGCLLSPMIDTWHRVDVLPAPTTVEHPVTGHARLAGADVALGAGTLALTESTDKAVTGTLALPATATVDQHLFGVFPTTARLRVTPGPVTGSLSSGLSTQAAVVVSDLSVLGLKLVGGTDSCASTTTIALTAAEAFSLERGGELTGTFDVAPFTGCGAFTPLVDSLLAKPANTITLTTG
ncbi:hypothetical protein ACOBQX_06290 [Actinokineospora sp. G85]|uniref:hypothetical protein n=1 Tax=Actinokineospora sp. G85 TaxID=3406626 RepID=UPI003C71C5F0